MPKNDEVPRQVIRSRQARNLAHEILRMAGVDSPPVDINGIAELLGFTIVPFDFPDSTAAVTFIEGDSKTIGVNSNHAPTRQRFSISHELGHYLSGHESYDHGKTHVENRPTFLDPQNRQEIEANEFASELLMPEVLLRRDAAQIGLDVSALAKRFVVSEQAMWIQLINLKIARQYAKS